MVVVGGSVVVVLVGASVDDGATAVRPTDTASTAPSVEPVQAEATIIIAAPAISTVRTSEVSHSGVVVRSTPGTLPQPAVQFQT